MKKKKKALKKDFRMEVRKSLNRFMSILFIVALGVAFYSGIQSASPDMKITEDSYFDDSNLMDIRVVSTMGLTGDDLDAIRQVEGVSYVEGSWQEDVQSGESESRKVLRIESLPEKVNQLTAEDGRLPEKPGEIFLDSNYALTNGYQTGDTLKITFSDDEEDRLLVRDTYTVCGYGNSPMYIAIERGSTTVGNGELSGFAYVVPEDFDSEVYTAAYVLVDGAKELQVYTDEYDDAVETVFDRIEEIQDARCEIRYQEVKGEAESELADGRKEVEDGKKELADAKKELAEAESEAESELAQAESELLEGESELADGKQELEDARKELLDGEKELDEGQQELDEKTAELEDGQQQLNDAWKELEDGESTWTTSYEKYQSEAASARKKLSEAQKEIDSGKKELEKGWATWYEKSAELEKGKEQYQEGAEQLAEAQSQYEAGMAELEQGQLQYDEGASDLEKGQAEYDAGAAKLEQGQAQYEKGAAELEKSRAAYEEGVKQLEEGEAAYAEGMKQLEDGRKQYEAGKEQLEQGKKEYQDGEAGLKQQQEQYDAAVQALEQPLAEYEAAAQELASRRSAYEEQLAGYQTELDSCDADEKTYQEQLAAYESSLSEPDGLRKQAEEAGQNADSLQTEKTNAEAAQAEDQKTLDDLNAQLEEQNKILEDEESGQDEKDTAQENADGLTKQISELENGMAERAKRLNELPGLIEEAQNDQKSLTDQADALQSRLEQDKADLDAAAAGLAERRAVLEETKAVLDQTDQALTGGETSLAETKAVLDQQSAALDEAKKQLEEGAQQLTRAKAELDANEKTLSESGVKLDQTSAQLAEARKELDENKKKLEEGKKQLEEGTEKLAASRAELEQGYEQLAASKKELDSGWEQLAASLEELGKGRAELEKARIEIEKGQAELDASKEEIEKGQKQLDEAKKELEKNEKKLAEGQKEIDDGYQQLKDGAAKLQEAREELDLGWSKWSDSQTQLEDGKRQLEEGRQQAEDARSQLQDARQQIADGEKEIAENEQKLKDGWSDYEEGKQTAADEIADAKQKIADAEQELADAEQKLADGEEEIAKIRYPEWYIYDRTVLPENSGYGENAERMSKLGEVFPVLFFLVAALISLTTMTRMVEEERTQIGTLKALGYGKAAIASKYLKYALTATLAGSILGILVGEKILPWVIMNGYGILYQHTPRLLMPYNWNYGLLASGAALLCTTGAAFSACFRELQDVPASLMRPPAPKQGKRVLLEYVPFIWKHLSFSWKSTIRNLLRYKKRCLMTIIGIGGCMGLLLVGYGLRDSIMDIARLQFNDIQHYEAMVVLDDSESGEKQQEVADQLASDGRLKESSLVYMQKVDVKPGHEMRNQREWAARIVVPGSMEDVDDFFTFRNRKSSELYTLGDEGAIVTEKLADELDLQPGGTITMVDEDKGTVEIPIAAICENYLYHYVYLSPKLYQEVFGKAPEYNSVMVIAAEGMEEELQTIGTEILEYDGALSVTYTYTMAEQVDSMLGALDFVILVLIISAGMLAFVVLYNLNNININERKRELATLKVLGFYDGEVAAYVYRENILLTIVGAIAGVFIGKLLHMFIIGTVEVDSCMFGRTIKPMSFLYGVLFTVVFSIIVNGVMYFKLKKIDMVESLKSIE